MTFTQSRTPEGRTRVSCDACGDSQAAWSTQVLPRWKRVHQYRCTAAARRPRNSTSNS